MGELIKFGEKPIKPKSIKPKQQQSTSYVKEVYERLDKLDLANAMKSLKSDPIFKQLFNLLRINLDELVINQLDKSKELSNYISESIEDVEKFSDFIIDLLINYRIKITDEPFEMGDMVVFNYPDESMIYMIKGLLYTSNGMVLINHVTSMPYLSVDMIKPKHLLKIDRKGFEIWIKELASVMRGRMYATIN